MQYAVIFCDASKPQLRTASVQYHVLSSIGFSCLLVKICRYHFINGWFVNDSALFSLHKMFYVADVKQLEFYKAIYCLQGRLKMKILLVKTRLQTDTVCYKSSHLSHRDEIRQKSKSLLNKKINVIFKCLQP